MKLRQILPTSALALVTMAAIALAQGPQPPSVTKALLEETLENLAKQFESKYVFPEVGKKMADLVRERKANGHYAKITDGAQLAQALTSDFRAINKDLHYSVRFYPEKLTGGPPSAQPGADFFADANRRDKWENGFVRKAERLDGNVGYVKFDLFGSTQACKDAFTAAMQVVKDTDALIIDLRTNGGGDPAMVAYVCSYFFDKKVHLNDIYSRPDDSTESFYTDPEVPGNKFLDRDVFVLTSRRTFSGAEECTYNLKNRKRATIVGETTGGGAHPVMGLRISDHFIARIPFARAINPITKTNWEGTGVSADISASSEQALKVAHKEALQRLLPKTQQEDRKSVLNRLIAQLDADLKG
ncbi:MAG TPA: S41 family peptidase [Fimbriimonadaceae bacterium]|nr:S41 family peptidase [Fimbriimonadaceae bacterium]